MQTSTEVAELFAALATAQGKFTDIVKDKKARIESQKGSYGTLSQTLPVTSRPSGPPWLKQSWQ